MGKQHLHVSTNMLAGWSGKMFLSSFQFRSEVPLSSWVQSIFLQVFHVRDVVFWINIVYIYIILYKFGWNKHRSFGNFSFKHGYVFLGGLGGGGKPSKMDGIFRWIFPWFPSLSGEVVCYFHQIHAVLTCWKWNKIGPLADCEWEFVQLNHGVWKRMEKGYVGTTPCPVTVTTKDYSKLLFENPYKPSFVTVILCGGLDLSGICISWAWTKWSCEFNQTMFLVSIFVARQPWAATCLHTSSQFG